MSVQPLCDEAAEAVAGARVLPRLDEGTQLVGLRWWPGAGELVAYQAAWPVDREEVEDVERARDEVDPEERARLDRENVARAARRARGRLRRYVVANALTRMVTLTFAPVPELVPSRWAGGATPEAEAVHGAGGDGRCMACGRPHGERGVQYAMEQAAGFVRRLRGHLGVSALPYALVPEFHKDGHVHVHVLIDRYVPKDQLARLWRFGWVDVRRFRGSGGGGREAARHAAAYACKYVAKAFETQVAGRHRYEVGQGFQPAVVKRGGFRSLNQAVDFVLDHGQVLVFAVHSDGLEDYDGPPFIWASLETLA